MQSLKMGITKLQREKSDQWFVWGGRAEEFDSMKELSGLIKTFCVLNRLVVPTGKYICFAKLSEPYT